MNQIKLGNFLGEDRNDAVYLPRIINNQHIKDEINKKLHGNTLLYEVTSKHKLKANAQSNPKLKSPELLKKKYPTEKVFKNTLTENYQINVKEVEDLEDRINTRYIMTYGSDHKSTRRKSVNTCRPSLDLGAYNKTQRKYTIEYDEVERQGKGLVERNTSMTRIHNKLFSESDLKIKNLEFAFTIKKKYKEIPRTIKNKGHVFFNKAEAIEDKMFLSLLTPLNFNKSKISQREYQTDSLHDKDIENLVIKNLSPNLKFGKNKIYNGNEKKILNNFFKN